MTLQPHRLKHARLPCPPTPRACSNSSIKLVMSSNHFIHCRPLLSSVLPSSRVFSKESVLHIRWPKYWSIIFSISPSIEYSGLISFKIDWFDLLAVQGTLKSLFQHHSSKASIRWHSAFFIVGAPGCSHSKESACSAGDLGLITVLGRSPEEGNGIPLQHSCLENPIDGGA